MTKVNGVIAVDFVDTANSFQKEHCFRRLEADTVVNFRKIEIRELPALASPGPI